MTHDPISQAGHSAAACEHGHNAPQWRQDARWSPCQQAAVRQGKETRCTAGPRAQRQLSVGMRWQCVLMRGIKLRVSEEDMKHAVKNLKENMHDCWKACLKITQGNCAQIIQSKRFARRSYSLLPSGNLRA